MAAINPQEDPAFLAFQRAQGYSEDQLRSQIAMSRARNDMTYANQRAVMAEQNRSANEDISNRYENMGDLGSGQRNLNLTRQATEYGRQAGLAQQSNALDNNQLEGDLASQIAQNRLNTAEQGLATRGTLAQYNASTLPVGAAGGGAYNTPSVPADARTAVKPRNYNLARAGIS